MKLYSMTLSPQPKNHAKRSEWEMERDWNITTNIAYQKTPTSGRSSLGKLKSLLTHNSYTNQILI